MKALCEFPRKLKHLCKTKKPKLPKSEHYLREDSDGLVGQEDREKWQDERDS